MVTLIYMQHFVRHEEEYDTLDEAVSFAAFSEAYETLAAEEIRDGQRVIRGRELSDMLWAREQQMFP